MWPPKQKQIKKQLSGYDCKTPKSRGHAGKEVTLFYAIPPLFALKINSNRTGKTPSSRSEKEESLKSLRYSPRVHLSALVNASQLRVGLVNMECSLIYII